jgi:DNA-binding IclR family transcriptional regulator
MAQQLTAEEQRKQDRINARAGQATEAGKAALGKALSAKQTKKQQEQADLQKQYEEQQRQFRLAAKIKAANQPGSESKKLTSALNEEAKKYGKTFPLNK